MNTRNLTFEDEILEGIPKTLPPIRPYDDSYNHAPKRKSILSSDDVKLALKNALRYFDKKHHEILIKEFKIELEEINEKKMRRQQGREGEKER